MRQVKYSHTEWNGGSIRLTKGPSGIRFTRQPSSFNRCIAGKMRAEKYANVQAVKAAFSAAAKAC